MNAAEYRSKMRREKGQCTFCGESVGKGRRKWCGDECVRAWKMLFDWAYCKQQAIARADGVCAACGFDSELMRRTICHLGWEARRRFWDYWDAGFKRDQSLVEVDHIVPRFFDGGNEPDNLQVLCVPCHKVKTARDAALIAKTKRVKKKRIGRTLFT